MIGEAVCERCKTYTSRHWCPNCTRAICTDCQVCAVAICRDCVRAASEAAEAKTEEQFDKMLAQRRRRGAAP